MFNSNTLSGGEPRFKAGDRVVFRRDITMEYSYESPWMRGDITSFCQEKQEFLERHDYIATISYINQWGFYELECDEGHWHYPDCWVEDLYENVNVNEVDVCQDDLLALIGG